MASLMRIVDGCKVSVIEGLPDVKIATDHLDTTAELCRPKLPLSASERIDVDGTMVAEDSGQVYGVEGRYVVRRLLPPDARPQRDPILALPLWPLRLRPYAGANRAHLNDTRVSAGVEVGVGHF